MERRHIVGGVGGTRATNPAGLVDDGLEVVHKQVFGLIGNAGQMTSLPHTPALRGRPALRVATVEIKVVIVGGPCGAGKVASTRPATIGTTSELVISQLVEARPAREGADGAHCVAVVAIGTCVVEHRG